MSLPRDHSPTPSSSRSGPGPALRNPPLDFSSNNTQTPLRQPQPGDKNYPYHTTVAKEHFARVEAAERARRENKNKTPDRLSLDQRHQVQQEVNNAAPYEYQTTVAREHFAFVNRGFEPANNQINPGSAMSLDVPSPDHGQQQQKQQQLYPNRLLPNPAKRKRYSIDDVTFQLGKVRVNKSGQAHINIIPPDSDSDDDGNNQEENHTDYYKLYNRSLGWDAHLDHAAFSLLPPEIQHSLRSTLTTRTVSQRKASSRIARELSTRSTSLPDPVPPKKPPFDIIAAISSSIEILQEVGKHLRPRDVLNLYSISRDFHATLDTHMRSSVLVWASYSSPLASAIFPYQFYVGSTVPDPMERPRDPAWHDIFSRLTATPSLPDRLISSAPSSSLSPSTTTGKGKGKGKQKEADIRLVPSLRYLQLLHARTVRVRDIIASLARQGHRLPPSTDCTLLKLWLIMDLPTNIDRCTVIKTQEYFTRHDLYRCSVFFVKLLMRFNDPLYGPDHPVLMELMLGQRGLTPLWKLLRGKGFVTHGEVTGAKIRYDVRPGVGELEKGLPVLGIPVEEWARGHLESWGREGQVEIEEGLEGEQQGGPEHLLRPDELVVRECARRGLEVGDYLEAMAVYGYVDLCTAENLVPSREEVYMSDEELPNELGEEDLGRKRWIVHGGGGNVPFREGEWDMKAVRKGMWETLSEEVKHAIREDDEDEKLRGLVWEEETREMAEGSGSEQEEEGTVKASSDAEEDEEEEEGDWREEMNDQIDTAASANVKYRGKMVDTSDPDPFENDSVFGGSASDSSDVDISSDESDLEDRPKSRVCSSILPELEMQSRITSFNSSIPVQTPSYQGSPNLVGIQGGEEAGMMDVDDMDLDEEMDSTMLGGSSMTVTPLKFPQQQGEDGGNSGGDEEEGYDEEDEEGYEEDSEEEEMDDDELKAQAGDYYSEDELEYDWDAWKEQAGVVIHGRGDGDGEKEEDEDDEEVREYHRLY